MSNIIAIYENGVFRPIQPVSLPEQCEVEVEIHSVRRKTAAAEFG